MYDELSSFKSLLDFIRTPGGFGFMLIIYALPLIVVGFLFYNSTQQMVAAINTLPDKVGDHVVARIEYLRMGK